MLRDQIRYKLPQGVVAWRGVVKLIDDLRKPSHLPPTCLRRTHELPGGICPKGSYVVHIRQNIDVKMNIQRPRGSCRLAQGDIGSAGFCRIAIVERVIYVRRLWLAAFRAQKGRAKASVVPRRD